MVRRLYRGTLLAFCMVIILGTAAARDTTGLANTPWPMFQHDPQHTGRSPFDSEITTPAVMWKHHLSSDLPTSNSSGMSIATDGTVYLGVHGNLTSVSYPDGITNWDMKGSLSRTVPAVADDQRLYWGFDDSFVVLSPTGQIMGGGTNLTGRFNSGGSSVIAPDGTVYIIKEALWSWTADGELNWYYPFNTLGVDVRTPALGADGTIYVVSTEAGGTLFAITPEGDTLWSTQFSAGTSPTLASDGTIYVGSNNGTVHAFSPNGTQQWVFESDTYGQPVNTGISSSPVLASDGTIYFSVTFGDHFAVLESQIYALNPNGSLKWKYPASGAMNTAVFGELVVDSQDRVIGCGSNHVCYAFNDDGTLRWSYDVGAMIQTTPLIPEAGVVWILDASGVLHALTDSLKPVLRTSLDSVRQCGVRIQDYEIGITTGDLVTSWTASVPSDAPWITLHTTTGTTSDTLKLSIDSSAASADLSEGLIRVMVDEPNVPNEVLSIPIHVNPQCSLNIPMLAR